MQINSKLDAVIFAREQALKGNKDFLPIRPKCPYCNEPMVKAAIEDADEGRYTIGWLCACKVIEDVPLNTDETIEVFVHVKKLCELRAQTMRIMKK